MKKITLTLFTISISLLSYAQIPTDSLIGYWPFNGNSLDQSGNSYNGTVSGATLTTDRFGQPNSAYNFDGVNDYIDLAYNTQGSYLPITISAWANPTTFNTYSCVVGTLDSWSSQGLTLRYNSDFGNKWQVNDPGTSGSYISSNDVAQTNQWVHLVTTIDEYGFNKMYVDGVLQNASCVYTDHSAYNSFKAGWSGYSNFKQYFHGSIDDIRIYNRELDSSEVRSLYQERPLSQASFDIISNHVKLFPNPSSGILNLEIDNAADMGTISLSIFNASSIEVMTVEVHSDKHIIDMTSLPKGIYLLKVMNAKNNTSAIKKIVLN